MVPLWGVPYTPGKIESLISDFSGLGLHHFRLDYGGDDDGEA